jgi:hypothetical protein
MCLSARFFLVANLDGNSGVDASGLIKALD